MSSESAVVRGDLGYGRKGNRGALAKMAQGSTVDAHFYDDKDRSTRIETFQDVSHIIKANVEDYNSNSTPSKDFRLVASIPEIEVIRLFQMGINPYRSEDWPKVVAMLDSSEWQKWRTRPGRIGKKPFREYLTPRGRRAK